MTSRAEDVAARQQVSMHGFLLKRNDGPLARWARRYVELKDGVLTLYNDRENRDKANGESHQPATGMTASYDLDALRRIDFDDDAAPPSSSSSSSSPSPAITAHFSGGRKVLLRAETAALTAKWAEIESPSTHSVRPRTSGRPRVQPAKRSAPGSARPGCELRQHREG